MTELSVCITAHNEENTIRELILKIHKVLLENNINHNFIILDNYSSDDTGFIAMETIAEIEDSIDGSMVSFSMYLKGYLEAYKYIAEWASGDSVFVIDADMQYDPREIYYLWVYRYGYSIVTGIKVNREDPLFRKIESRIFSILVGLFFGKFYYDGNCGFRLYRKDALKYIEDSKYLSRSPGTEAMLRADMDKAWILEIAVNHYPRKYGKSTVSGIKDIFNVFKEQIKGLVLLWKESLVK